MKKTLSLVMIILFYLSMLTGCGGSQGNPELSGTELSETVSSSQTLSQSDSGTVSVSADDPVAVAELQKSDKGFNLKGYINLNGEWVISPQYEEAHPFVNNVATVMTEDGIWKLINKSNETIAEFAEGIEVEASRYYDTYEYNSFDYFNTISDDRIIIKKDGLFGVADTAGNIIVEPKYDEIGVYNEGMAPVYLADSIPGLDYGYLDIAGNVVISGVGYAHFFRDGLAYVQCDVYSEKYGYGGFIDKLGELVIPVSNEIGNTVTGYYSSFYNGVALAYTGVNQASFSLIDHSGEIVRKDIDLGVIKDKIIHYTIGDEVKREFTEGLCPIFILDTTTTTYKIGFLDTEGEFAIVPQAVWGPYDSGFSEGYCKVGAAGKYGYIDTTGKLIIPIQYSNSHPFTFGLAAVETDNETWEYIDATGKTVIKIEGMSDALPFSK